MQLADNISGFEWDKSNKDKTWHKHRVSWWECEEVFFNIPFFVYPDLKHSSKEKRFYALAKTNASRFLFIVFAVRKSLVRVISARDMHKKERKVYLEEAQKAAKI